MTPLQEKLKELYDEYLHVPFPPGSEDDEVDAFWLELESYDSYAAGLVTRIFSGSSLDDYKLYYDESLDQKMRQMALRKFGEAKVCLTSYIQYMEMIKKMVELAQKCLSQSERGKV